MRYRNILLMAAAGMVLAACQEHVLEEMASQAEPVEIQLTTSLGLDVDAVGVGTVSGGRNPNPLHLHVVAPIEHYVEHLAVHRCHSHQLYVLRVGKFQCLSQILYNSISLIINNHW